MAANTRFSSVSALLLAALWAAVPAAAETVAQPALLHLCLRPGVSIPLETLPATAQEVRLFSPILGSRIEFHCGAKDAVSVILEPRPRFMPPDALAAVRRVNGKILPELHIFSDAVTALLPVRDPRVLARALALVIAHECLHYLRQSDSHAAGGIQMRAFTSRDLERGGSWWAQQAHALETPPGQ